MNDLNKILDKEEISDLRQEVNDLLSMEDCDYEDMEELLLGYGLEMDYFEQLIF